MNNLRRHAILELSKQNTVLDNSKLRIRDAASCYREISVHKDQVTSDHEETHRQNEKDFSRAMMTSTEYARMNELLSPLSCASDLMKMYASESISGIDDLQNSRPESPVIYKDISDNTENVSHKTADATRTSQTPSKNAQIPSNEFDNIVASSSAVYISKPLQNDLQNSRPDFPMSYSDISDNTVSVSRIMSAATKTSQTPSKDAQISSNELVNVVASYSAVYTSTPFKNDLQNSRPDSPMTYRDISDNIVSGVSHIISDATRISQTPSKSAQIPYNEFDNVMATSSAVHTSTQLQNATNSVSYSKEVTTEESFKANLPKDKHSTPTQIIPEQLQKSVDSFERSLDELIAHLSSEQQQSRDSTKSTTLNDIVQNNKRVKCPKKKLEIEKKKHPIRPPCANKCIKKCATKFSFEDRNNIWNNFRDLNKQNQRNFISRNVLKKRKSIKTTSRTSRRRYTLTWMLNDEIVCKTFFLNTLGFSNDQTVNTVLKANEKCGIRNPKIQQAAPEQRCRGEPWNKFSEDYKEQIKNFINKMQPTVSHYNLKHAPYRRYLPCGVTFKDLFKDFGEYCDENNKKKCSWAFFWKIIKKMNLSTSNPKQDLCSTCAAHKETHPLNPEEEHLCSECDCAACKKFENHDRNKKLSRQCLDEDLKNKDPKKKIITADMQKVITMPKLTVKECFFARKLILFNETFIAPGKNEPAYCIVWHEAESGRNAYNLASVYVKFITQFCRDFNEIVFYVDNCSAQNKNRTLYSALLRLINCPMLISTQILRIVYLEPGHTYMAADTVHANISRKLSRMKNLYDKDDFISTIKKSRKNLDVLEITHEDMIIFNDELKKTFPRAYNVNSIKVIEFRQGSKSLYLKNSYDQAEYVEFRALKPQVEEMFEDGSNLLENIDREDHPRGISAAKKRDLLKLCPSMPACRRAFFENLPVNDNAQDSDSELF